MDCVRYWTRDVRTPFFFLLLLGVRLLSSEGSDESKSLCPRVCNLRKEVKHSTKSIAIATTHVRDCFERFGMQFSQCRFFGRTRNMCSDVYVGHNMAG